MLDRYAIITNNSCYLSAHWCYTTSPVSKVPVHNCVDDQTQGWAYSTGMAYIFDNDVFLPHKIHKVRLATVVFAIIKICQRHS